MSGLRARLKKLERGAGPASGGQVFDSVCDAVDVLQADLRDHAASWTPNQRAALAGLQALRRSGQTKFADLADDQFARLRNLGLQRFAAEAGQKLSL